MRKEKGEKMEDRCATVRGGRRGGRYSPREGLSLRTDRSGTGGVTLSLKHVYIPIC